MAKLKTNFACLLNLLGARPRDLCEAVGADKSLVSRWCNGKQKLMPNHAWIEPVADYLTGLDEKLKTPILPSILSAYYPVEKQTSKKKNRELLLRWLAQIAHKPANSMAGRTGVIGLIKDKIEKIELLDKDEQADPIESQELCSQNSIVYGIKGVQASALQLVEVIIREPEPQELLFVCPEGLEMLSRDKKYYPVLMDSLAEMFAAGHTLGVVLRTDFRISDVVEISGRWLVAHLMGYVHSYYYDDFIASSKDKMIAAVPNKIAGKTSETDTGEIFTAIQFDRDSVDEIYELAIAYKEKSKQRFHYSFFENPDGFLHDVAPSKSNDHYRIASLPHFGIKAIDTIQTDFSLTDEETEYFLTEFYIMTVGPDYYSSDTSVRYIFCENDIEDALLKSRHSCPELSVIFNRRIMMKTQNMIDGLIQMKKLLLSNKNYEVCFLSADIFKKLTLQLACWGDRAVIGWIPHVKSTACADYLNVNALTGFCGMVWNKIPAVIRSRATAMRKLNIWLKKAAKYGYNVSEPRD
jgi:Disulfide bond chaperones of the HSP33 family